MTKRWKLIAGVLVLALALVACGGDDEGGGEGETAGTTATTGETAGTEAGTVSAEEYVASVCTGVSSYIDELTTMSNDFAGSLDPTADVQAQKDAILGLFDQILAATDGLIDDLAAAGVPDVEGGQEIVDTAQASYAEVRTALADVRAQVEDLAVDDPAAFATELGTIGTAIQSSLSGVASSVGDMDSPELSEAAANEPACAEIRGGAGTT